MREWLTFASENAAVAINAMAVVVIVAGTIEAFFAIVWVVLSSATDQKKRDVWARYARWLVAGLTFQLAADIVETVITINWDALGRLAAIAVIRTFLNYFLERDLNEVRERNVRFPAKP